MTTLPFRSLALATLVLLGVTHTPVSAEPSAPSNVSLEMREAVRNAYIVRLRDDIPSAQVRAHAQSLTHQAEGQLGHLFTHAIKGFSLKLPDAALIRRISGHPLVVAVEPDQIAIASAQAVQDSAVGNPTCVGPQIVPWGVQRVGGPLAGVDPAKTAWVIDTGIDFEHPDLAVDRNRSVNFVHRGRNSADDANGHGTHVAGTIAALDNGCDVVGVAPGARLVAVRVLDASGAGTYSGVIKGIDHVAAQAQPGDVANLSLGGPYSESLNAAVVNAAARGIHFSLAAGNESASASYYSPASAAALDTSGGLIYTVSAIDEYDFFAWFSNHGNPPIDCSAPGVAILSTQNGGGTVTLSGTSMAAPHVAGLLLFGEPMLRASAINDPDGMPDPVCTY